MNNYRRKTKIICTIGPASCSEDKLRELMLAGMDVARFNFSHGEYETFEEWFATIDKVRKSLNIPVATLLDTKGPEVRTGCFKDPNGIHLDAGDEFILTADDVEGTKEKCSISYKGLPRDVKEGTVILIDDGLISLKVKAVKNNDIICTVVDGGPITNHKGVNVPNVSLALPYLSEKDMQDLKFGAKMGFDFIAASFCRTGADIVYLRNFCHALGWNDVRIIAKIENNEGVDNIDDIIREADGIMVARGDMGVEIPFEKSPPFKRLLSKKCLRQAKLLLQPLKCLNP